MNETQFRIRLQENGFESPVVREYPPEADGDLHSHEFDVMLLVQQGPFILATESGDTVYQTAEVCELAAGVLHVERTGELGARVLLGKRAPAAAYR
ncbi:MAG: hypothetical protein R3303_07425 [Marinobacter sp.]|nr:hypothetical protein [Marinobacter sp.]